MGDGKKAWAEEEEAREEEALRIAKERVKREMDLLKKDNDALTNKLRFEAACTAMQGLLTTKESQDVKAIAKLAVRLADALLEELK